MAPVYIVLYGFAIVFGASAVAALVWAVRTGQMRDFQRGAASIFDNDEPIGKVTDRFPGEDR
jgi:cbb3-type cytochrome oxidase maturation protein